ncbi:hypothetical protein CYMTET_14756 [Cymbomonas tetramitiformis]|uniref:Uncharacterized protein n=1 Tax=Cymbomonas tetramitiformis TaxID=36881 RepID=A0AAE0GFQ8_9CHLO|nr:hypothetical protein CYMTET_14756 [Cymbomonas tetramitiformis]
MVLGSRSPEPCHASVFEAVGTRPIPPPAISISRREIWCVCIISTVCTLAAFAYAGHLDDDDCGLCNSIAYSVNLRLQKHADLRNETDISYYVGSTCDHVGCAKKTAKCNKLLAKHSTALTARIRRYAQQTELVKWPQSNLLAVQRILCHDLAQVCPWDIYHDAGLHMEL